MAHKLHIAVALIMCAWRKLLRGPVHRDAQIDANALGAAPARNPEAERRAHELLVRLLNPAQRACFEQHHYFYVASATGKRFCILPFSGFNVLDIDSGECFCAGPKHAVPLADLMLAQKLMLECDPPLFFAVANRRREIDPMAVPQVNRPAAVIQARTISSSSPRVRWIDVSMLP